MEATNTHFNQAQLKLLDMLSYVKTPQALQDLENVISDYFAQKAQEEMEKTIISNADYIITEDKHFNVLKEITFPKCPSLASMPSCIL